MELSTYRDSGHNVADSSSSLTSPSSSSPEPSSPPKSSSKRRYLPPDLRYFFKFNPKPKPIILGSETTQAVTESNSSPRPKAAWRALLHPRPFTKYMALNFGILSGFSLTGTSIGGLIAGAGLGLIFGLGAAGVVAVGWELCSPESRRSGGVFDGDKVDSRNGEGEEGDIGGIELSDFGKGDRGKDKVQPGGEDFLEAELGDVGNLEGDTRS